MCQLRLVLGFQIIDLAFNYLQKAVKFDLIAMKLEESPDRAAGASFFLFPLGKMNSVLVGTKDSKEDAKALEDLPTRYIT